jgi:hypothetical protein
MAVFRWDPPKHSNGIIEGYKIKCWYSLRGINIHICDSLNLEATKLEFTAFNLSRNSTYYFQVQSLKPKLLNSAKGIAFIRNYTCEVVPIF